MTSPSKANKQSSNTKIEQILKTNPSKSKAESQL